MPMPEGAQLHRGFSPILTTMAISYLQDFRPRANGIGGFIGTLVLPNINVGSPAATFNKWLRGDFLRLEAKELANAEPAPIGGFKTGYGNYSVKNYGIAANWTARDLAEARQGGISDEELIAAKNRYVVEQAVLRREVNAAALFNTAGSFANTYAGVTSGPVGRQFVKWSQPAATPVDDIINIVEDFRTTAGFPPNTMVIPWKIFNSIRKNASMIDRIKYGGTMDRPTEVTLMQIKALFGIENIYIPDAVYNSAKEDAEPVYVDIWDNTKMWIGYVNPNPRATAPSAGYHFTWTGDAAGNPGGLTGAGPQSFGAALNPDGIYIREYSQDRPAARFVEAELWTTPNVTAPDMGMVLSAAA